MKIKTLVITHSNFFADFIKHIIPDKNIVFHIVLDQGLNIKKKLLSITLKLLYCTLKILPF
jgi:hypothetical protein